MREVATLELDIRRLSLYVLRPCDASIQSQARETLGDGIQGTVVLLG